LLIYRKYFKRTFDIVLSVIALTVLSPVILITAFIVRIKLGKHVIFKQERPGKDGKIFTIYKFRTMTDARDENGNLLSDEIRLTRFGRLLRSTSLDELPELINIIKGDMSIIGPRPLSTLYLPYYNENEKHRHDIRPGLSGLAQVNGRNTLTWEERFDFDLEYVHNITFVTDCKIIIKTIGKVIKKSDIFPTDRGFESFHIVREKQMHTLAEFSELTEIENHDTYAIRH